LKEDENTNTADITADTIQDFWFTFLKDLAEKTRSPLGSSRKLKRAIRNATNRPEIFISVGIHGNILFSDTGYCEFDDPAHAWKFIEKWAKISSGCSQNSKKSNQQTCFPIGFEIGICTLEELSKKYPIWKLLHDNHVEIINSLYSQPYLRHIGEESNFRQFLIGLETLSKNNLSCHVFFSSEHSLHPQLPQLLKGFNIELAFATNRLGGASPTTNRPKVIWIGKDDTEITSIVSQSGISNGQIWHGKFFQELPHLLFSAYSRPDLNQVFLSNIEDLAYNFKEIPTIMNHIQEFERVKIHFRKFYAFKEEKICISRRIKWTIEDFPLHILQNSDLIHANRNCEDHLVNIEAVCALLNTDGNYFSQEEFKDLWRDLLISQNHDAYIVPFTTPGLYMVMQGLATEYIQDPNQSIGNRSLNIVDKINQHIFEIQASLQQKSKKEIVQKSKTKQFAYTNWLWERDVLINGIIYNLPSIGYCKEEPNNDINERNGVQKIKRFSKWAKKRNFQNLITKICDIKFDIEKFERDFEQKIANPINTKAISNENTIFKIEDCLTFLKIDIKTDRPYNFTIKGCESLEITYPFGMEPSSEHSGHCLRFFWINHEFILIHKGLPFYSHENSLLQIKISKGDFNFALAYANSRKKAFHAAWEFFYPSIKIAIDSNLPTKKSLIAHKLNDFIPTSIRNHPKGIIIRGFMVGKKFPEFSNFKALDFFDNEFEFKDIHDKTNFISKNSRSWRILTFLIESKKIDFLKI